MSVFLKKNQFFDDGISIVNFFLRLASQLTKSLFIAHYLKMEVNMSLIKRNGNQFPAFPALFDDFFGRELFNWGNNNYSSTSTTVPAVNIRETDDNFEVEVAAPGMDKKDFKITLDGNLLTISSAKQHTEETKEKNYSRREFSYQSFQRSFELQKDVVDEEKINARYENGLLLLTIPKKEEAKQKAPRTIEIG
ncbi:HSP20 family protein [Chitinophaga sp. W2I13]